MSSTATRPRTKAAVRRTIARIERTESLWTRPGYLIRRLHQIHHALFLEECKAYNVTPVQYGLMQTLLAKGVLDQVTLGGEVGLDRTNVADVLTRLERRGLLMRRPDPNDGRARLASLTPKGRALAQRMSDPMRRAQERLLAPLDRKARDALLAMLAELVQANNEYGRTVLRT